ncbi:hypothetical protein Slin15195_G066820 [Septoria linicola]|uniref:Uncharacterized protein n=1 Tax=Septoria linicola TaxID=215465 RepID=A0A9Q9AUC7_9PEZI|nr:hypothetical protein Slin15195_G066820 [Septoria linicola]
MLSEHEASAEHRVLERPGLCEPCQHKAACLSTDTIISTSTALTVTQSGTTVISVTSTVLTTSIATSLTTSIETQTAEASTSVEASTTTTLTTYTFQRTSTSTVTVLIPTCTSFYVQVLGGASNGKYLVYQSDKKAITFTGTKESGSKFSLSGSTLSETTYGVLRTDYLQNPSQVYVGIEPEPEPALEEDWLANRATDFRPLTCRIRSVPGASAGAGPGRMYCDPDMFQTCSDENPILRSSNIVKPGCGYLSLFAVC